MPRVSGTWMAPAKPQDGFMRPSAWRARAPSPQWLNRLLLIYLDGEVGAAQFALHAADASLGAYHRGQKAIHFQNMGGTELHADAASLAVAFDDFQSRAAHAHISFQPGCHPALPDGVNAVIRVPSTCRFEAAALPGPPRMLARCRANRQIFLSRRLSDYPCADSLLGSVKIKPRQHAVALFNW
jgi:hypothetical protein